MTNTVAAKFGVGNTDTADPICTSEGTGIAVLAEYAKGDKGRASEVFFGCADSVNSICASEGTDIAVLAKCAKECEVRASEVFIGGADSADPVFAWKIAVPSWGVNTSGMPTGLANLSSR